MDKAVRVLSVACPAESSFSAGIKGDFFAAEVDGNGYVRLLLLANFDKRASK